MRNRVNSLSTSGLLQTFFGSLRQRARRGTGPENEEWAGKPQIVDEGPTKHWTTIVVAGREVSAECRCGWRLDVQNTRDTPTRVGVASYAARQHRTDMIPDVS